MKNIFLLNKKEGETPLEALNNFRKRNIKYKDLKMTYAGRLDPMATGLLLILTEKEIKNKEKYLALDKEYVFEILFGFATDTYDILGKVKNTKVKPMYFQKNYLEKKIKENLKKFIGKFIQKYPVYSSKTVKGRPLFEYARENLKVKLPEHKIEVKNFKFLKLKKINNKKLYQNIEKRIKKVQGDFRQKEILSIWEKYQRTSMLKTYFLGSFKIKCSSGTYVRSIANDLGGKINIPTLAFSIKRTKIGKWSI